MWSVLNFGRYRGKTLPQVLLRDPDYFFWAAEDGALDRDGFADDACLLDYRARNIKIPKPIRRGASDILRSIENSPTSR